MSNLCLKCVFSNGFHRINEASYKVFFDMIEAQGRALLRIPLASLPFTFIVAALNLWYLGP